MPTLCSGMKSLDAMLMSMNEYDTVIKVKNIEILVNFATLMFPTAARSSRASMT